MITQEHTREVQREEQELSLENAHILTLSASSIYSEEEERVLGPWQQIRQVLFSPIALVLSRLGIARP